MRMRETSLILSVAAASVTLLGGLTGCEDADARARGQAQQIITQASHDFRKATARPLQLDEPSESARIKNELNAIVNRLNAAPDGDAGQSAAKSLLLAEALHELAGIDLARIDSMELAHRNDRMVANSQVGRLIRLEALAAAREALSTSDERRALQRDREQAEMAVRALAQHVQELEAPIADRTERNRQDAEAARRLREEANNLTRRAMELGYREGFTSFELGAQRRREADRLDYQIAHREIELNTELEPAHELTRMSAAQMQAMIESINRALRQFDEMEQTRVAEISRLRQEIETVRTSAAELIRTLSASTGGELADLYNEAATRLERAASLSRQAASRMGQQGQVARLTEARSSELLGRVLATRVHGIASQIALLNAAIDSRAMGGVQAYQLETQNLAATQAELTAKAVEAYASAEQALSQVGGNLPAVEAYRANLQRAIAALAGEVVDWSQPLPGEIDPEGEMDFSDLEGMSLEDLMMMGGEVTPEQLLAALEALDFDTLLAQMPGVGDSIPPEMRPMLRQAFDSARRAVRVRVENGQITTVEQFQQALMEEMMKGMGMGGGGMGGMGGMPR
ncbi:MAG TPA: hypothetical protein PK400_06920 [Phycisphaerales bacterium]|nr:hypothetical protein [Phycisphaerales bacterium]HRQ75887.1 hypothetical protein [Phycisphaerales bacterium]